MSIEILWKSLKSKTINFGLLLSAIGLVQANLHLITDNLTPTQQGWATIIVGWIVIGLRYVTNKPVSEK